MDVTTSTETAPPDLATMRDVARQALADASASDLVPTMRGMIDLLTPQVQALIRRAPLGAPSATLAQVALDAARQRFATPAGGFGPDAARRRARLIALSVLSLCDHFENLGGQA
ncbi:DUF6415 family natural product biosynthesis protein [Streptomyces sp. NPDC059828]|uniref:DUF6415 family natural product biosynthesis protein n=1 Tax=Streptomyces sp. NPDC059828 TaxID=3346965 RepID=UPI00365A702C